MLYDSKQWIADLDTVIESLPFLSEFEKTSVMITGATGLVCSAIVDILIRYNETHENQIKIICPGRSHEKMMGRFGSFAKKDFFSFVQYDATSTNNTIDIPSDYIIHGASNATPNSIINEPVETILGNIIGLKQLFEFAKACRTKRVLYISSSEIYGIKKDNEAFKETEYGYIDLLNPRNSYSIAKRAAETLCISYSKEYNVESVIVRPGHIYGPTASSQDNRVSSAWAYAAAKGNDIIMKSPGSQMRSYCYCLDCASAILTVLFYGQEQKAYNISNRNSIISIRQLGEAIANAANVRFLSEEASSEEKKAFNPMENSSLNSETIEQLGWRGLFDASCGIRHTITILKETRICDESI